MSNMIKGTFDTTINYKGWDIEVTVYYDGYKGTTSTMGDDPDYLNLMAVYDGTNSNILKKLPTSTIQHIKDLAYDNLIERDYMYG
jgi:hypothetical protein